MIIIGIIGKAGSGKSTLSKYLVDNFDFTRVSFADPLKQICINAGMVTPEECYGEHKTDHSRWVLQKVGTEIFRNQVNPDYWVEEMDETLYELIEDGLSRFVIDDLRFPNEANFVKSFQTGTTIRLIREDFLDSTAGTTHASESLQDTIIPDYTITAKSGDIQTLQDEMRIILIQRYNIGGEYHA